MNDQHDSPYAEPPDELVPDVPPDPPDALGAVAGTGTGLRTDGEQDPYGIEIEGADIVHSDRVGAAELSAEYSAGQAATDTDTELEQAEDAWHEAADDSVDRD